MGEEPAWGSECILRHPHHSLIIRVHIVWSLRIHALEPDSSGLK